MSPPSAIWTVPSIDPAWRVACLASMAPDVRSRTVVVRNEAPHRNRGVAASWNAGIDAAEAAGVEWLVLVSESVRFGAAGGRDFRSALDGDWCDAVCDATCTSVRETGAGFCRAGFGWHLVGLHWSTMAAVGRFDEQFYPGLFEDADYLRRMALAGLVDGRRVAGIDAHLASTEHSTAAGLVGLDPLGMLALYLAKWGGPPGEETFALPYEGR